MLDVKEIKITESNIKTFFQDNGYSDEILTHSILPLFCVKIPYFPDSETISSFYKEIINRCITCLISIANKNNTDLNSENNNTDFAEENINKSNEIKTHAESNDKTNSKRHSMSQHSINRRKKAINTLCPLTMHSTYNITSNDEKILSLYTDQIVMNEKKLIFFKRTAQTWLIDKQRLMSLSEAINLLNLKRKVKKSNDFFVTENGIVIFHNKFEEPKVRIRQSQYENLFLEFTEIV